MSNEVEPGFIGFLANDRQLYCSRECAGGRPGREVDLDEYQSLEEGRRVEPVTLCPGCGAEFPVDWPGRTAD
jgi:hypothetical protein